MTYKSEAKASGAAKMHRMGLGSSMGHRGPHRNDATPYEKPTISGTGRTADIPQVLSGAKAKARLDRPGYARGGKIKGKGETKINIIVAPGGGAAQPPMGAPPMGMPPGAAPPMLPKPPMMPAGGAPGAGPGMPPGALPPGAPMPMRARGGRVPKVKMDAGSGSGLGRLEKAKDYGAKAKR